VSPTGWRRSRSSVTPSYDEYNSDQWESLKEELARRGFGVMPELTIKVEN
jgi:hypothetical protein